MIAGWATSPATPMYQGARAAAGHPYDPRTGSGIEWQRGSVRLWDRGRITEYARHYTASPFEFWFWLAFADVFPSVTHWWFGTAWTGRVWARARPPPAGGRPIAGGMRFEDGAQVEQPWHIQSGDPPHIATPLPPGAGDALSLALRLALGQLVWEIHTRCRPGTRSLSRSGLSQCRRSGQAAPDGLQPLDGVLVTSLVPRGALPEVFPLTPDPWYPVGVDRPLRQALCHSLGLHSPAWLAGH